MPPPMCVWTLQFCLFTTFCSFNILPHVIIRWCSAECTERQKYGGYHSVCRCITLLPGCLWNLLFQESSTSATKPKKKKLGECLGLVIHHTEQLLSLQLLSKFCYRHSKGSARSFVSCYCFDTNIDISTFQSSDRGSDNSVTL